MLPVFRKDRMHKIRPFVKQSRALPQALVLRRKGTSVSRFPFASNECFLFTLTLFYQYEFHPAILPAIFFVLVWYQGFSSSETLGC